MFQLDLKSRKSIYEQVIDNLKELIMTRVLSTDEKLPSVRELSKEITVNPNTVQKAYRELERQGYVYTTSGVGTFVADIGGVRPDTKELELAKANLDDDFRQLLYLGLSFEEASKFLNLSKSYLYKLTSGNLIPHYKPQGKMLYFEKAELEAWLRQNPVKTQAQIEQEAQKYVLNRPLKK